MKSISKQLEDHKATIERLYAQEGKTAKEVLKILLEGFDFEATENQLKKKLKEWSFNNKNIRAETMMQIARSRAKRGLENKQSGFRVNKKLVPERNIDKFMDRKEVSWDDLMDMQSPQNAPSQAFSVFTPESWTSSPPPLAECDTASGKFVPSIDFNMLSIMDTRILRSPELSSYLIDEENSADMVAYANALPPIDIPSSMDQHLESEEISDPVERIIASLSGLEDERSPMTEGPNQVLIAGTTIDGANDTPTPVSGAKLAPPLSTMLKDSEGGFEFPPSSSEPRSDTAEGMNRYLEGRKRFIASELREARKMAERYSKVYIRQKIQEYPLSSKISSSDLDKMKSHDSFFNGLNLSKRAGLRRIFCDPHFFTWSCKISSIVYAKAQGQMIGAHKCTGRDHWKVAAWNPSMPSKPRIHDVSIPPKETH
ncbi:hypothetical protein DL98DRAFT_587115 [Cadophora sp. DSE1049]|nr:hypothetical protein DL98DRAFT_587115 [Cadophora sp. DSE1049]